MSRLKIKILGVLSLLFAMGGFAQHATIMVSQDKDSILIGEQIKLTLIVTANFGTEINFPPIQKKLGDQVEVIDFSKIDTTTENDKLVLSQQLVITSFDSGVNIIPPFELSTVYKGKNEKMQSLRLAVYVKTVKVLPEEGIRDVTGPLKRPLTLIEYLFYFAITLLMIGLGYYVYRYVKQRKAQNKAILPFMKSPDPPHVFALRELEKLKSEKVWQQGRIKLYYSQLTEILRKYLEGRYHIHALEQTTGEILENLENVGFNDKEMYAQLNSILTLADLVKFARADPLPDENEGAILHAVAFVNNTKPVEQEERIEEPVKEE